jgi:hypothetical protein
VTAARAPRAASVSRPLPSLERLAASLAVSSVIAAPAAAMLLRDPACVEQDGASVQRLVSRLERAGALAPQTEGVEATPGACLGPVAPAPYVAPAGGPPQITPSPSVDTDRIMMPGEAPAVTPVVPEHHLTPRGTGSIVRPDNVRPPVSRHR